MDVRKTPCGERESEREWLGLEAGYFVRRPLREKASPNITRGPERLHKGCEPPLNFSSIVSNPRSFTSGTFPTQPRPWSGGRAE